ncbi:MAG: hypothetical protein MJ016_08365, partial [Victivallaceae bacterium]|nr:hypothetical protein [Victivallaceae bacterium]
GTQPQKIRMELVVDELGFDGVIVSDALVMGGITRIQPYEKRIVDAFNAGIDIMLWPELDYFDLIEKAISRGEIPETRLDDAVRRILRMKFRQGLFDEEKETRPAPDDEVFTVEGKKFAENVARRGIALVRDTAKVLPLDRKKTKRVLLWFAVQEPEKVGETYRTLIDGFKVRCEDVVVRTNGNCLDLLKLEDAGENFDAVIFLFDVHISLTHVCRPRGAQAECLWTLGNTTRHHPIAVGFNSPYLLMDSPTIPTLVNAHSAGDAIFKALPEVLFGETPFTAQSPVRFPDLVGVDDTL